MKKFFGIIIFIAVLAVAVYFFCSGKITFGEKETTTEPSVSTQEITTDEVYQPSSSTTTTTTTTVTKIETDSLETILHNIKDFPLGTAGSVSKGYQIVYKLLNYTQNSDFTADEAKKDYANFKSDLSDTQKIQYEENLFEIDYIARQVIENPDILTQHIENCDPISDDGEISLSSYEKLYKIISE